MALNLIAAPAPADAADLAARISEAEQRLRAALLDGLPTRDVHAEIASLKATAAALAAAFADAQAEAEAQAARMRQERVSEAAANYVRDIARRLESRMAALVIPPFTAPTTTRTNPR